MTDGLDALSAAFAEFMTPDDSGTPLLMVKDLGPALDSAGIPSELASRIQQRMNVANDAITFEDFINVAIEITDGGDEMHDPEAPSHVFDLLSDSGEEITRSSLAEAARKVKLELTDSDIDKMLQIASSKDEFLRLWSNLTSEAV